MQRCSSRLQGAIQCQLSPLRADKHEPSGSREPRFGRDGLSGCNLGPRMFLEGIAIDLHRYPAASARQEAFKGLPLDPSDRPLSNIDRAQRPQRDALWASVEIEK